MEKVKNNNYLKLAVKNCISCNKPMPIKVSSWTYQCSECKYWFSLLNVSIDDTDSYLYSEDRDDEKIISFLDHIRKKNFTIILNEIEKLFVEKKLNILDVGCASGLFMKMADLEGHHVVGIEPNFFMAKIARNDGLRVLDGYFPDSLNKSYIFDVIIFNDVFEHIPDIDRIAEACKDHLVTGGAIVINLPNSDGILFRIAKNLYRIGIRSPWERLWQKMFNTPHLHYFNPKSLSKFLNKHGYHQVTKVTMLDTFTLDGLWERISIDRSVNIVNRIFLYLSIAFSIPIIKIFTQDAFFVICKKNI